MSATLGSTITLFYRLFVRDVLRPFLLFASHSPLIPLTRMLSFVAFVGKKGNEKEREVTACPDGRYFRSTAAHQPSCSWYAVDSLYGDLAVSRGQS